MRQLNEWAGAEKEVYRLPTEAEWEYTRVEWGQMGYGLGMR